MKHKFYLKTAFFTFLILFLSQIQLLATELPKIVILGTGGTIAGSGESKTSGSYEAGVLPIDSLVKAVPGIDKLAFLTYENVANIGSQNMNDKVWLKLANRVNEILKDPSIAGVVITHGTDTMEETAYFLNLVVKTDKPIVLTGSMRPSTSLSPDGPINMFTAIAVASSPESTGKGVLIVMSSKIFSARDVTKTNTTNVDTFKSPNTGPIGIVNYDKVRYYVKPARRNTAQSQFDITKIENLPPVCIIYEAEGGATPLIKAALEYGYKGIVLAGVGDGNMPREDQKLLIDAVKKGVAVVISSRVGSGCVQIDAEVENTKYHLVTANSLNPQKARILLRVALTQTNSYEDLQKIFTSTSTNTG
jgi:L-asparaginase